MKFELSIISANTPPEEEQTMLRTCSAYEMSSTAEVPVPMPRNQSEDNLLTVATESQAPVPKPRPRTQASLDSLTSPSSETAPVLPSQATNGSIPEAVNVPQNAPPAVPAVRPVALAQSDQPEQPPVPKPRKDLIKNVEPSRSAPPAPAPRTTNDGKATGSIGELGSPGMEAPPPPPSVYLGDPGSPPPPPPTEEIVNQFSQQNGMNGPGMDAPGPVVPPRPKTGPTAPPVVPSRSAPPPPVPPRRDLINK